MPAADAPAFAPISDRMCTTAMAAAKGMLPSHDDSAMLQWRREAVQHRVNGYRKKHVRVTQAKEQAVQNMAKLQQHQVSIFSSTVIRALKTGVTDAVCGQGIGAQPIDLKPARFCVLLYSSSLAGFLTLSGATNSRPPAMSRKRACAVACELHNH